MTTDTTVSHAAPCVTTMFSRCFCQYSFGTLHINTNSGSDNNTNLKYENSSMTQALAASPRRPVDKNSVSVSVSRTHSLALHGLRLLRVLSRGTSSLYRKMGVAV